jgi:hypothetical protein
MHEIDEPNMRQISRLTPGSSTASTKENAMAKSEEDESAEVAENAGAKNLAGKARKASKARAREVVAAEVTESALGKPSEEKSLRRVKKGGTTLSKVAKLRPTKNSARRNPIQAPLRLPLFSR